METATLLETKREQETIEITAGDEKRALIAAIRWKAAYSEDHTGDDYHLYIISQLLKKLCLYDP